MGRPVGGFGCGSAVVEVRGRGGHHRLGRSVMGSWFWSSDCLMLFWLAGILRGRKVLWEKWKHVTYTMFWRIIFDNN